MSDLDLRCQRQERELDARIERIYGIERRHRGNHRMRALLEYQEQMIIELHHMRHCHDSFDRRFNAALDDPTGQDLDDFPYDFESDSERFNEAGERKW